MFFLNKNISIYKLLLFLISTFLLLIVVPKYYVYIYSSMMFGNSVPNPLFNLLFDNIDYELTNFPFLILFFNSLEYGVTVLVTLILLGIFTFLTLVRKEILRNTNLLNKIFKLCLMSFLLFFLYFMIVILYDIFSISDNLLEFETLLKD